MISTKTPTFVVQHRNHVCWLLHQIRVFYDRFDDEYGGLGKAAVAEIVRAAKYNRRNSTILLSEGVRRNISPSDTRLPADSNITTDSTLKSSILRS